MELRKEHINAIRKLEKDAANKLSYQQLLHIILDYLDEQIDNDELMRCEDSNFWRIDE